MTGLRGNAWWAPLDRQLQHHHLEDRSAGQHHSLEQACHLCEEARLRGADDEGVASCARAVGCVLCSHAHCRGHVAGRGHVGSLWDGAWCKVLLVVVLHCWGCHAGFCSFLQGINSQHDEHTSRGLLICSCWTTQGGISLRTAAGAGDAWAQPTNKATAWASLHWQVWGGPCCWACLPCISQASSAPPARSAICAHLDRLHQPAVVQAVQLDQGLDVLPHGLLSGLQAQQSFRGQASVMRTARLYVIVLQPGLTWHMTSMCGRTGAVGCSMSNRRALTHLVLAPAADLGQSSSCNVQTRFSTCTAPLSNSCTTIACWPARLRSRRWEPCMKP